MIGDRYRVEYSSKQVRVIMKNMGMNYAKPFQHDRRRPDDAEGRLKKLPPLDDEIVGFLDETSPQTSSNIVRRRSFHRPEGLEEHHSDQGERHRILCAEWTIGRGFPGTFEGGGRVPLFREDK